MTPAAGSGSSFSLRDLVALLVAMAASVLAVVALVLIALGVFGLASTATPTMRGFTPGATVNVTESGLSVYARSDEERAGTVCRATGEDTTILQRPTSEFAVEVADSDFYEVARGPEALSPGSYELRCEGTRQALYVGPAAPSTSASGLIGATGLVIGLLVGFLAGVLGIATLILWVRRSSGPDQPHRARASESLTSSPPDPSWAPSDQTPTERLPQGYGPYSPASDARNPTRPGERDSDRTQQIRRFDGEGDTPEADSDSDRRPPPPP